MASDPNWIEKATANAHGQFKAKAKKAGESTKAFAQAKKGGKGVTAKQAQLVANLMNLHKGKPKAMPMDAEDMMDGGADEATEKN